ncbi:hypothetical protein IKF76_01435 [Candidatus Saccharibacteria bacterium]|nr:hypothetical protein [Candidatus Saccharibacteria bacterium]
MEKQASKSVVGDVTIPKLKMNGKRAAYINAAAVAIATYFGVVAIFGAIAGFTKGDWAFSTPGIVSAFFGTSLGMIAPTTLFVTTMLALVGGVIGFFTLKKLTDAAAVKHAWSIVAEVFGVVTGLLAIYLISTVLWSLFGLGEKSGVSQGDLWLSTFLPAVIKTVLAGAIFFLAKKIAAGKLEVLRIFSMVSSGIAVVALIIVIVQTMISFYDKKSSSDARSLLEGYDWSDWLDF